MWSIGPVMLRALAVVVTSLGLAVSALALGDDAASPTAHLQCVAPDDAPAIDRMLLRAGSPLAGEGATFVRAGRANDIDPRFLVAVAAHETVLETYGPAAAIHNPFGLGPGIVYPSERAAITAAGSILSRGYLAEGRDAIATIAPKWAPIGAANDPGDLNSHWTAGVSRYYDALGGDPASAIRLSTQTARPPCGPESGGGLDGSLIWIWDGREPLADSPAPAGGGDPLTGDPARPAAFVFPVAARSEQPVVYLKPNCAADADCPVILAVAPGTPVVAAVAGTLRAATPAEQAEGIGFWLEAGEDRFGYSALAGYAEGARDGATVGAGQVIGTPGRRLVFRWQRTGTSLNPYPLLEATRPATL